jgi:hypothetical protein
VDDKQRAEVLEAALAQLLQPLKNIPFTAVVRALAEHSILKMDPTDAHDADLIGKLSQAATICGERLRANPIKRPRPNEVGNDVEPYVIDAVKEVGLTCARPVTKSGALKSTGYPDILITGEPGRKTYLECKIFSAETAGTTQRSFYLSPSDDFKVCHDARHLLIAFEMVATPIEGSRNSAYSAVAFKLVDLHDLLCDVKYEFNSDNRRLYGAGMVLASGQV